MYILKNIDNDIILKITEKYKQYYLLNTYKEYIQLIMNIIFKALTSIYE